MSMSGPRPDIWMPFYWGDYLRDTGHLAAQEHGAYLLLIGHYWTTKSPLPDDDRKLARIARVSGREWAKIRDTISDFFFVESGCWKHKRVEHEIEKCQARIDAASRAGKASAAQRAFNARSTDVPTGVQREGQRTGNADPTTRARVTATATANTAIEPYLDKSSAIGETGLKKFGNGFNGISGKWGSAEDRDQYATAECVKHLPGRDEGERWAIALAAEDPKDPNHRAAVTAMLAAAKKAKVGWVSPERRKSNGDIPHAGK